MAVNSFVMTYRPFEKWAELREALKKVDATLQPNYFIIPYICHSGPVGNTH